MEVQIRQCEQAENVRATTQFRSSKAGRREIIKGNLIIKSIISILWKFMPFICNQFYHVNFHAGSQCEF